MRKGDFSTAKVVVIGGGVKKLLNFDIELPNGIPEGDANPTGVVGSDILSLTTLTGELGKIDDVANLEGIEDVTSFVGVGQG